MNKLHYTPTPHHVTQYSPRERLTQTWRLKEKSVLKTDSALNSFFERWAHIKITCLKLAFLFAHCSKTAAKRSAHIQPVTQGQALTTPACVFLWDSWDKALFRPHLITPRMFHTLAFHRYYKDGQVHTHSPDKSKPLLSTVGNWVTVDQWNGPLCFTSQIIVSLRSVLPFSTYKCVMPIFTCFWILLQVWFLFKISL